MNRRFPLTWSLVLLLLSVTGCGLFIPSRHATLDYKPIHSAVQSGDLAQVKKLVQQDAQLVNPPDWDNVMPLHLSVVSEHKEEDVYLLEHGARVNAKTKAGATSLHFAAQKGNEPRSE